MGIIGRLHRLAAILDTELRPIFADAGLGSGDFDVLATLRRAGEPFELTPGQMMETSMVTSGAITKRIDRLEAQGLVTREVDAADARSRRIRLTPRGRELVDDLVGRHLENERRLISVLTAEQQHELAGLLETWSRELD